MTEIELLKHQLELIKDRQTLELLLLGGYGAGKSKGKAFKHLDLCFHNQGFVSLYGSPTFPEVLNTGIPDFEMALEMSGVPYKFTRSPHPRFDLEFKPGQLTKVLCMSMENWRRWRGLNLSHATLDEIDTMKPLDAKQCWEMALSRLRAGNILQLVGTTTPEEFGFCYERFHQQAKPGRRIIHAKTTDNFFLPESFVESLLENYTEAQVRAYVMGEFVNTKSDRVYYTFDRRLNASDIRLHDARDAKADLHIGVDFNVGAMSAITHVVDEDDCPIAVDEILGSRDTPSLIKAIEEKYHWSDNVIIYPDSSGKNRSSKGASLTDIRLFQDAGFYCNYPKANPRIKDRVNSMNAQFCNSKSVRRYLVSILDCPGYVESLEKQGYGLDGLPEKGKFDGPLDAGGYFISRMYGVDGETRSAWI